MENNELLNNLTKKELSELRKMLALHLNEQREKDARVAKEKLYVVGFDANLIIKKTGKKGIDASKITTNKSVKAARRFFKLYKDAIKGSTTFEELERKLFSVNSLDKTDFFSINVKINPIINYEALDRIKFISRREKDKHFFRINPEWCKMAYPNVDIDDFYFIRRGIVNEGLFTNLPINFCYISKFDIYVGDRFDGLSKTINFDEVVRFEDFFYELERLGLVAYTNDYQGYFFSECLKQFNNLKSEYIDLLDEEFPQYGKTAKMKFLTK